MLPGDVNIAGWPRDPVLYIQYNTTIIIVAPISLIIPQVSLAFLPPAVSYLFGYGICLPGKLVDGDPESWTSRIYEKSLS